MVEAFRYSNTIYRDYYTESGLKTINGTEKRYAFVAISIKFLMFDGWINRGTYVF